MNVDRIVGRWAVKQARLGNPKAPQTMAELNLLGPARDHAGIAMRAVIVAELFMFCVPKRQIPAERGPDGVWRLSPRLHMRMRRALSLLVQEIRFGLLFDVMQELPLNPDGTPRSEVRLAVTVPFADDPELRRQLGLSPISTVPRAQA